MILRGLTDSMGKVNVNSEGANNYSRLNKKKLSWVSSSNVLLVPALIVLLFYAASLYFLFETSFYPFIRPGEIGADLTLKNYIKALTDSLYVETLYVTFRVSFFATIVALLIGYPVAYRIVRTNSRFVRAALIISVAVPFLTNVIVRMYTLSLTLGNTGLINTVLHSTGILPESKIIPMMRTELGVGIGLVYFVLPFVIFTLTSSFRRLDQELTEAAQSLGAGKVASFFLVTLPLSKPGIIGAASLSFILCVPAFSIPLLLGEGSVLMIANAIYDRVLFAENLPFGAALAVLALIITLIFLILQMRLTRQRYHA